MKKIKFRIEKTKDGFSAYADKYPVFTWADNIVQLRAFATEAFNLYADEVKVDEITPGQIEFVIDLKSIFETFRFLSAKGLAKEIHMNESLLSQYISGKKTPSSRQTEKILNGLRSAGEELSRLTLVN